MHLYCNIKSIIIIKTKFTPKLLATKKYIPEKNNRRMSKFKDLQLSLSLLLDFRLFTRVGYFIGAIKLDTRKLDI